VASTRRKLTAKRQPMADRRQDTWYVSFERKRTPPAKRPFARATLTFRSETEAKAFARQKLAETENISAGTLNPYVPKRVIPSAQIARWLNEL
jgi:hypothetical protein